MGQVSVEMEDQLKLGMESRNRDSNFTKDHSQEGVFLFKLWWDRDSVCLDVSGPSLSLDVLLLLLTFSVREL